MSTAALAVLSLLALHASRVLDPGGAALRAGWVLGAWLGVVAFRPLLPGGDFQRVLAAAGLTAAAVALAAGSRPAPAMALVMQTFFMAIFLVVADAFTFRRGVPRRFYSFAVVLAVSAAALHFALFWIPHLRFPRPHLTHALGADACAAVALAAAAALGLPGMEGRAGPLFERPEPVPVPPELEMGGGAGRGPLHQLDPRDTLPPPAGTAPTPPPDDPGAAPDAAPEDDLQPDPEDRTESRRDHG